MKLLVDLGNSRMKWACWEDDSMAVGGAVAYDTPAFFQYAWSGMERPQKLFVSSVAGSGRKIELEQWVSGHWDAEVVFLKSTSQACGVTNGYQNALQLGIDRWAAMVAAYDIYQEAIMVVDCGTAVTIDVIDGSGLHRGGMIVPGLEMMRHSLHHGTAEVGHTRHTQNIPELGNTTASAIEAGIHEGLRSLIVETHSRWQQKLGTPLNIVVTGGDAQQCKPAVEEMKWHLHTDLVLEGVALLAGLTKRSA